MHKTKISRKEFLTITGTSLASLAFNPNKFLSKKPEDSIGYIRVTVSKIYVYKEPSYQSDIVFSYSRDELVYIYSKFISPLGPRYNPRWYQVDGGYIHTAHAQPVETNIQRPTYTIQDGGQVGEISVPMTQSFRFTEGYGWQHLYRLYYKSTHWVMRIEYGPANQLYYVLLDELLDIEYMVAANHVRIIPDEELTPISPDLPSGQKYVEVNRHLQSVTAFEGKDVVFHTEVSTGIPSSSDTGNGIPTTTPAGDFNISLKMPFKHMGDGKLTSDINAYELPGVPWVSFFHETGVAFHGTYWHDNYGNEMSHGCVNMRPEEAKWLWRWVTPTVAPQEWEKKGYGTRIYVI